MRFAYPPYKTYEVQIFKSKAGHRVRVFRIVVAMDGGAEAYMDVLAAVLKTRTR
ncbi:MULTISPECIES: hypothetical protein [Microbulbifer]|uniref:Uncharacterized protein n=1 Tax=Microbulbifer celer TaxID=435905 RepID=A0ABW3U9G2_9GAMM|nr:MULTISPECIES: hypothetical protein [Microbulbifer]UFN57297.1 hypothetical protein LPW13_17285 [Microbulbifer celer]